MVLDFVDDRKRVLLTVFILGCVYGAVLRLCWFVTVGNSCFSFSVIEISRCVSVLCCIGACSFFTCVERTMGRGQSPETGAGPNGDLW